MSVFIKCSSLSLDHLVQALRDSRLPVPSLFDIEDVDVLRKARALEEEAKKIEKREGRIRKQTFVPSLKRQREMAAERRHKRAKASSDEVFEVIDLDETFDEEEIEEILRPDEGKSISNCDSEIIIESSDEEESESAPINEEEEYQETLRKIKVNESMYESNAIDLLYDDSDDDIEILEERLLQRRAKNGGGRKYEDTEPRVKTEINVFGELEEKDIMSLEECDLVLCESESDESQKQNDVDKYLFWTIGRSLGHFGERMVSRNSLFCKNEIFSSDFFSPQATCVQPADGQAGIEFEKMFVQLQGGEDHDATFFSSNEEDRLKNPFFLVKLRQVLMTCL